MIARESRGMAPAPVTEPCFVYIVKCADGTFYVGATTDLSSREKAHNEGHGSDYTSGRRPVRIVYSEAHRSWPAARKREVQIKRWSHAKKQALVDGHPDRLHRLARRRHY
jgi:putative endonuclease